MKRFIILFCCILVCFDINAQSDRFAVFGQGHMRASSEPQWMYKESALMDLSALNVSLYATAVSLGSDWDFNLVLGISDINKGLVPKNSRLIIELLNGETLTLYSNSDTETTAARSPYKIEGSPYERYIHMVFYTVTEEQLASLTFGVSKIQVHMKDRILKFSYPEDIWSNEMFQQIKELTTYMQCAILELKTMYLRGEL